MNWQQLQAILWLRWRLSCNQWKRGGTLNALLSVVLSALAVLVALASLVGGVFAGFYALASASPLTTLIAWDIVVGIFLFFWMMGIVVEIQRSETIDLSKFLHLPVSLRQIFLVNYLTSHFTLSIILVLPGMLGLSIGLTIASGPSMLLLLPLVFSFLFMVTAWTYCLRGWLVALMVNKRRRRAIIVGISMAAVILGQLPNLIFNSPLARHSLPDRANSEHRTQTSKKKRDALPSRANPTEKQENLVSDALLRAHTYLPPVWISYGSMALRQGRNWPAIWGSLGASLIGTLGFLRAYQLTFRFYQGKQLGKTEQAKVKPEPDVRRSRKNLVELDLPGIPEEAAALALVFFRSILRAPEVKMSLLTPFVMLVVFGSMQFSRNSGNLPVGAKSFVLTGVIAFSFFGMIQLMSNLFGFDREGFRALVLLPVRRDYILLAKNICLAPLAMGMGWIFLIIIEVILRLPLVAVFAAGAQLGAAFLVFSLVGNFVSIVAPYRIAAGSLKPTKTKTKTTFLIFFLHLFFPIALIPIFVPAALEALFTTFGWWPGVPINLLGSIALFAFAALLYRFSLGALGAMFQRREKDILLAVSQEVE